VYETVRTSGLCIVGECICDLASMCTDMSASPRMSPLKPPKQSLRFTLMQGYETWETSSVAVSASSSIIRTRAVRKVMWSY
jgi:hypothetical protein